MQLPINTKAITANPSSGYQLLPKTNTPGNTPRFIDNNNPSCKEKKPLSARAMTMAPATSQLNNIAIESSSTGQIKSQALRFYIENDQDRQTIIHYFRNLSQYSGKSESGAKEKRVFYINSPEAFETQQLLQSCSAYGQPLKANEKEKEIGRLYGSLSLTIIIDLTVMYDEQISGLNDLLEMPGYYEGRSIGPNISRVVLTDTATESRLSGDYSRRIKRFHRQDLPRLTAPVATNRELIAASIKDISRENAAALNGEILRFYNDQDWREQLLGRFDLTRGSYSFTPGAFARLQPGANLVLWDAPWHSEDFLNFLATALREKGVEVNQQWLPLPANMGLYRGETTAQEIQETINQYRAPLDLHGQFIRVNQSTFDFLLNPTRVQQDHLVRFNPLAEWVGTATQIRVTETLCDQQWLLFFHYFEQIPSECRPSLFLGDAPGASHLCGDTIFRISEKPINTAKDLGHAKCYVRIQDDDITAWDNLFQEIYLRSRLKQEFITNTYKDDRGEYGKIFSRYLYFEQFIKKYFDDLFIFGVRADSGIAKKFQTLNESPPYLFFHGKKEIITSSNFFRHVTLFSLSNSKFKLTDDVDSLINWLFKNWSERKTELLNGLGDVSCSSAKNRNITADFLKKIVTIYNSIPSMNSMVPYQKHPTSYLKEFSGLLQQTDHRADLNKKIQFTELNYKPISFFVPYFYLCQAYEHALTTPFNNNPKLMGFIKSQFDKHFSCAQWYPFFYQDTLSIWKENIADPSGAKKRSMTKLTFPCPPAKADGDALYAWLCNHPEPDRKTLQDQFWSLVWHCPVWTFSSLPTRYESLPDEQCLNQLAAYLTGAARQEQQPRLAQRLGIATADYTGLSYYSGHKVKQLTDWLQVYVPDIFAAKQSADADTIFTQLSEIIEILERQDLSDREKTAQITPRLINNILATDTLPPGTQDFPQALVSGDQHGYIHQRQRLSQLARDIEDNPMLFLVGETGAGKTWMAEVAATMAVNNREHQYRPKQAVWQLTIGPDTSQEELFGQQVIKKTDTGDEYTEFVPGPLLKWAANKTNPPVLILNEANLARPGILAPLADCTHDCSKLHFNGRSYCLSDRHRIVLTGNPVSYEGRQLDPALAGSVLQINMPPVAADVMALSMIRPALPARWSSSLKGHACGCLLTLFRQYQCLLPEDPLTPRDIQDLLAIIKHSLDCREKATEGTPASLTVPQVNSLICDAFRQCLDNHIAPEQRASLAALNDWSRVHFPADNSVLAERNRQFNRFLSLLQARNKKRDIDLQAEPVVSLVRHIWLSLAKGETGRRAMLVEGPPGWGKDLILDRVLDLWFQLHPDPRGNDYTHITVNNDRWELMKSTANKAAQQGSVAVFSELNTVASKFLEGPLNGLLTEPAEPGFRVFATINPSHFAGRETLSPALKSRFTRIKLVAFTATDIRGFLTRMANETVADWLTDRFVLLCEALAEQQSALQPSMADLMVLLGKIRDAPATPWPSLFRETFDMELQQCGLDYQDLKPEALITTLTDTATGALAEQINTLQWLVHPVTVSEGTQASWDASRKHLVLSRDISPQQQLAQARELLADHGVLSDSPPGLDELSGLPDYLITPDNYPSMQGVDLTWPDTMPDLKNPSRNKLYISEFKSQPVRERGFYRAVRGVLNFVRPQGESMARCQSSFESAQDERSPGSKCPDHLRTMPKRSARQQKASSEYPAPERAMPTTPSTAGKMTRHCHLSDHKRFATGHFTPQDYRLGIYQMNIQGDGLITCDLINPEASGVSIFSVAPWPFVHGNRITLSGDEVLGSQCMDLDPHWQSLPGLSARDELIAIQCRQHPLLKLELARSRGTGQLLVRLAEGFRQGVQVDFIIKPSFAHLKPANKIQTGLPLLDENSRRWVYQNILFSGECAQYSPKASRAETSLRAVGKIQKIVKIPDAITKIRALAKHFQSFRRDTDISGHELEDILPKAIKAGQGTCLERSMLFVLCANAFNVPTRLVINDPHAYAEYSPDQGINWHKQDLGGSTNYTLHPSSENFPDYSRQNFLWDMFAKCRSRLRAGLPSTPVTPDLITDSKSESTGSSSYYSAYSNFPDQVAPEAKGVEIANVVDQVTPEANRIEIINHAVQDWLQKHKPEKPAPATELMARTLVLEPLAKLIQAIESKETMSLADRQKISDYLQQLATDKRLGQASIRWVRERLIAFFLSKCFIHSLTEHPGYVELIRLTLSIKPDNINADKNAEIKALLLNTFRQQPWFSKTRLCDAAFELLNSDNPPLADADILPVLEAMTGHSRLQKMALDRLNDFYQTTFTRTSNWHNDLPGQSSQSGTGRSAEHRTKPMSSYLHRLLRKSVPVTTWCAAPTGRPPSIDRMIRGQNAFPKRVSGHGGLKPAIIHLQGPLLQQLKSLCIEYVNGVPDRSIHSADPSYAEELDYQPPCKRQCLSEPPGTVVVGNAVADNAVADNAVADNAVGQTVHFASILHGFLHWLGNQDANNDWCWLVSKPAGSDREGGMSVMAGNYRYPPPLAALNTLLQTNSPVLELSPARLRTVLKKPKAVLLNHDAIKSLFMDYWQQNRTRHRVGSTDSYE